MGNRNKRNIEQIEQLETGLKRVLATVQEAIEMMREAKLEEVYSSGDSVIRVYLPALQRFARGLVQDVDEAIVARETGTKTAYEIRRDVYEREKSRKIEKSREAAQEPTSSTESSNESTSVPGPKKRSRESEKKGSNK